MFAMTNLNFVLFMFVFVLKVKDNLVESCGSPVTYTAKARKDCIADGYRQVLAGYNYANCVAACSRNVSCRSFKMTTTDCHLFAYTKTSHKVNKYKSCNATTENIWFKTGSYQECPTGFGNKFYGTKYLLILAMQNQSQAVVSCQLLGGFSRLADTLDLQELEHIANLMAGDDIWLDAAQIPGSAEPRAGWKWTAANVDFDPVMWDIGEPNNSGGIEHSAFLSGIRRKMYDFPETTSHKVLCEAVCPFN